VEPLDEVAVAAAAMVANIPSEPASPDDTAGDATS